MSGEHDPDVGFTGVPRPTRERLWDSREALEIRRRADRAMQGVVRTAEAELERAQALNAKAYEILVSVQDLVDSIRPVVAAVTEAAKSKPKKRRTKRRKKAR